MITYEMIKDAQNQLITWWDEQGEKVIEECARVHPFNANSAHFLNHCSACGGNWGGMLLTGIHELYPNVWEVIPEDMGPSSWSCIYAVLVLCGVDISE